MKIYDLLVGSNTSIKGCIWCTDGSLIGPSKFKESGKKAYGYALSDSTLVRLTRSIGMPWSSEGSIFYTTDFIKAHSLTDGEANSRYLKSIEGFSSDNCPAIYYGCTQTNGGRTSYMPSVDEITDLYNSIMYGYMRDDLITAGIYTNCNYRSPSNSSNTGWIWVWSSSQSSRVPRTSYDSNRAWIVIYSGDRTSNCDKYATNGCVIPFFKV